MKKGNILIHVDEVVKIINMKKGNILIHVDEVVKIINFKKGNIDTCRYSDIVI